MHLDQASPISATRFCSPIKGRRFRRRDFALRSSVADFGDEILHCDQGPPISATRFWRAIKGRRFRRRDFGVRSRAADFGDGILTAIKGRRFRRPRMHLDVPHPAGERTGDWAPAFAGVTIRAAAALQLWLVIRGRPENARAGPPRPNDRASAVATAVESRRRPADGGRRARAPSRSRRSPIGAAFVFPRTGARRSVQSSLSSGQKLADRCRAPFLPDRSSPICAGPFSTENGHCTDRRGSIQRETDTAPIGEAPSTRETDTAPIGEAPSSAKRTLHRSARLHPRAKTDTAPIGEAPSSAKRTLHRSARLHPARNGPLHRSASFHPARNGLCTDRQGRFPARGGPCTADRGREKSWGRKEAGGERWVVGSQGSNPGPAD